MISWRKIGAHAGSLLTSIIHHVDADASVLTVRAEPKILPGDGGQLGAGIGKASQRSVGFNPEKYKALMDILAPEGDQRTADPLPGPTIHYIMGTTRLMRAQSGQ